MSNHARLKTCGFSFAVGVSWGLGALVLGLLAWRLGLGLPVVHLLSSLYKGYAPTLIGSFKGAGWAFLDGLISGFIIAVIYNGCCCCAKSCRSKA